MSRAIIEIINIYQRLFSPDHSFWAKSRYPYGYCRFYPTCSEYTKDAVKKYGAVQGLRIGLFRVLRCNPFAQPGIDHLK